MLDRALAGEFGGTGFVVHARYEQALPRPVLRRVLELERGARDEPHAHGATVADLRPGPRLLQPRPRELLAQRRVDVAGRVLVQLERTVVLRLAGQVELGPLEVEVAQRDPARPDLPA